MSRWLGDHPEPRSSRSGLGESMSTGISRAYAVFGAAPRAEHCRLCHPDRRRPRDCRGGELRDPRRVREPDAAHMPAAVRAGVRQIPESPRHHAGPAVQVGPGRQLGSVHRLAPVGGVGGLLHVLLRGRGEAGRLERPGRRPRVPQHRHLPGLRDSECQGRSPRQSLRPGAGRGHRLVLVGDRGERPHARRLDRVELDRPCRHSADHRGDRARAVGLGIGFLHVVPHESSVHRHPPEDRDERDPLRRRQRERLRVGHGDVPVARASTTSRSRAAP